VHERTSLLLGSLELGSRLLYKRLIFGHELHIRAIENYTIRQDITLLDATASYMCQRSIRMV
jgi:hypothetical protein